MYKRYETPGQGLFTDLVDGCKSSNSVLTEKYKKEADYHGLIFLMKVSADHAFYLRKDCGHCFKYQTTNVRSLQKVGATVRCPVCLDVYKKNVCEKYDVEELIRLGSAYIFKRNKCGHEFKCSYEQVEMGMYCLACKEESDANLVKDRGLKIIGRHNRQNVYQLPCGHTKTLALSKIRDGNWYCEQCYEDRLQACSESKGCLYVGKSNKGAEYRLIQISKCGHYKSLQTDLILNYDSIDFCQTCFDAKLKSDANEVGLTLIGKPVVNGSGYRKYKMSCCGSHQEISHDAVRSGSFKCFSCGNSSYTKPSNLYLIEIETPTVKFLKLGYARLVDRRIGGYGLVDCKFKIISKILVSRAWIARQIEENLHKKFKSSAIDKNFARQYLTKSGYTECYEYGVLEEILKEMEVAVDK